MSRVELLTRIVRQRLLVDDYIDDNFVDFCVIQVQLHHTDPIKLTSVIEPFSDLNLTAFDDNCSTFVDWLIEQYQEIESADLSTIQVERQPSVNSVTLSSEQIEQCRTLIVNKLLDDNLDDDLVELLLNALKRSDIQHETLVSLLSGFIYDETYDVIALVDWVFHQKSQLLNSATASSTPAVPESVSIPADSATFEVTATIVPDPVDNSSVVEAVPVPTLSPAFTAFSEVAATASEDISAPVVVRASSPPIQSHNESSEFTLAQPTQSKVSFRASSAFQKVEGIAAAENSEALLDVIHESTSVEALSIDVNEPTPTARASSIQYISQAQSRSHTPSLARAASGRDAGLFPVLALASNSLSAWEPESLVTDEVSALHFERFKLSQVLQTLPVEARYTSEELSKIYCKAQARWQVIYERDRRRRHRVRRASMRNDSADHNDVGTPVNKQSPEPARQQSESPPLTELERIPGKSIPLLQEFNISPHQQPVRAQACVLLDTLFEWINSSVPTLAARLESLKSTNRVISVTTYEGTSMMSLLPAQIIPRMRHQIRNLDTSSAIDEVESNLRLLAAATSSAVASGARPSAELVCDEFLFVSNFDLFYGDSSTQPEKSPENAEKNADGNCLVM